MEGKSAEPTCLGLILAHLLLIPHYLWGGILILIFLLKASFQVGDGDFKFYQFISDIFLAILIGVLLFYGLFFIIPISFCLDFWILAMLFSTKGIEEAFQIAFVDMADKILNPHQEE